MDNRLQILAREAQASGGDESLAALGAAFLRSGKGVGPNLAPEDPEHKGFMATGNKGFRLRFPNGWAVSVQWGPGNYAEGMPGGRYGANYNAPMQSERGCWEASSAEVAIFTPSGSFLGLGWDDVAGYLGSDTVAALLATVAALDYDADLRAAQQEVCAVLGITPGDGLSGCFSDDDDEEESEPTYLDLIGETA